MIITASTDLKYMALHSTWHFIELIKLRGGIQYFEECHYDFLLCLDARELWHAGLLTSELQERWESLVGVKLTEAGPSVNKLLKYPRGHYKSTLLAAYVMRRVWKNPNIRILWGTNVRGLSQAFVRELRSYFEDADLQATVFNLRPHRKGNLIPELNLAMRRILKETDTEALDSKVIWNREALQMVRTIRCKEPTIMATSVESSATGNHYDISICDDIVDFKNSKTATKIESVKRWAADLASLVDPHETKIQVGVMPDGRKVYDYVGGQNIVSGTHYNPNDYYAFLSENLSDLQYTALDRNIYRNLRNNSDGYLMSTFTEADETRLRKQLSEMPGVFEAQYLNMVNNPILQVLSSKRIQWVTSNELLSNCKKEGVSFRDTYSEPDFVQLSFAVDPASSVGAKSDYSAIVVAGVSRNGKLVIADYAVGHYNETQLLNNLHKLILKWKLRRGWFESLSFQEIYRTNAIRYLKLKGVDCAVLGYKPTGNKLERIQLQLRPWFTNDAVLASDHLRGDTVLWNMFDFFGRGGSKDDAPDALATLLIQSAGQLQPNAPRVKAKVVTLGDFKRPPSSRRFNSFYGGIY
jgi:predicted phage terminase large subunit-like protein